MGYSPRGHKESDMIEPIHPHGPLARGVLGRAGSQDFSLNV